jgi:hypothetical protein
MSVVMIMKIAADPAAMESWVTANGNGDTMVAVAEEAKTRGVTRHLFAAGDGEVVVIDEWPDEQSFRGFFADQQAQIGAIMRGVGVPAEPHIKFTPTLNTPPAI